VLDDDFDEEISAHDPLNMFQCRVRLSVSGASLSILEIVNCSICGIRKAKRACPGVRADICTICCGTEREQSIDCPIECEFLQHAHEHENTPEVPQSELPDRDVDVDEDFLRQYEWVLIVLGSAVVDGYKEHPASTDYDAREALAGLVKTWHTAQSGLVYESQIVNPYAAAISESVKQRIADIQLRLAESGETGYLTDSAVLKLLVFLRRLEMLDNNGRKRSRAFLDMLNRSYAAKPKPETSPEPDEPRIIL
jgi:hypothetical protein